MLNGNHLVAGHWVSCEETFENQPVSGEPDQFAIGDEALVDRAALAASHAFHSYGSSAREVRADFLRRIADEIEVRGAEITAIGQKETALPASRLDGERGRTTGQLRLFADHIEAGDYLDRRHDPALPDRRPLPRPDLRLMQRPIGPVAVFGASNFPLAFSVAGGDTASALAAGCPVVVKAHSAHPGVSDLVAQAIDASIRAMDLDPGVFSLIHGGDRRVGQALVEHPAIRAVGFTGSREGGRALFDLCAGRSDPIPFFGEMGSINPVFVLETALDTRGPEIAKAWVASLTLGAGQFCTNPGLLVLPAGACAETFVATAENALANVEAQTMLTEQIASAYETGRKRVATVHGVKQVRGVDSCARSAMPSFCLTDGETWLANPLLADEVFGPFGILVTTENREERLAIAGALEGQLTCSIHLDEADFEEAESLVPILETKSGRLVCNGFPTGVEVCDSMVHGGPYPASTNFGATSVGTMAIRRFLRPVCYQGFPTGLLPDDLRSPSARR